MAVFKIHYHHGHFYYQNALHLLLLKPFLEGGTIEIVTTMICVKIKTKATKQSLTKQGRTQSLVVVVAEIRNRPDDHLSTHQTPLPHPKFEKQNKNKNIMR